MPTKPQSSNLPVLSRALSKIFSPAKPRRVACPDYGRFRRLAAKHGLVYELSGDGHIDIRVCRALPRGLSTAHYDWSETLERVEHCIANPELVDANGSYRE